MISHPTFEIFLFAHSEVLMISALFGFEDFLQKWYTPPTPCSSPIAFRNLSRKLRLLETNELPDLLNADMKTNTDFIMILHGKSGFQGRWFDIRAVCASLAPGITCGFNSCFGRIFQHDSTSFDSCRSGGSNRLRKPTHCTNWCHTTD